MKNKYRFGFKTRACVYVGGLLLFGPCESPSEMCGYSLITAIKKFVSDSPWYNLDILVVVGMVEQYFIKEDYMMTLLNSCAG